MRRSLFFSACFFLAFYCQAQNVGIGTTTPAEKLDVNGNANISGQLKMNGSTGTPGQLLMKDASNNPVWGDITDYKNIVQFDCQQIIGGGGAGNCSASWTVPAGVTKILVECWGGGGGGGTTSGGGGGGYITAKFTVNPGDVASLQTGAGGAFAGPGTAAAGGTSLFSINGSAIFANGGEGAVSSLSASFSITLPAGGSYLASGLVANYRGRGGGGGLPTRETPYVVGSTTASVKNYGDGGDAAGLPGSGAKGGYYLPAGTFTQIIYAAQSQITGGGGGGDSNGGSNGRGGAIIIHY